MDAARTGATVLVACCALILPGCGAAAPAPEPAAPQPAVTAPAVLPEAVAAAVGAGSARITGSIATTTADSAATATLSGVQSFDPAAMDLSVRSDAFGAGQVVRQLLVGGRAFVQLPEFGEDWVPLDTADFAGALSPLLSGTDISALPPVVGDGTGTVEGAAATFYTADIGLADALRLAGLPERAGGGVAGEEGTARVRIGVDESGRLVQWQVAWTLTLADGTSTTSTADLRFYDFGVATDITAPAPDRVVDPSSLRGRQP